MITVGITLTFVSENDVQINLARSGESANLIFISYAVQADAFDVFLQNYLQAVLDNHQVYSTNPNSPPFKTEIENSATRALGSDIKNTYEDLYEKAFGITCQQVDRAYSVVFVTLNNQMGSASDVLGTGSIIAPLDGGQRTAIRPEPSRYGLKCTIDEPPIEIATDFDGRWYYLDANCICCQAPGACLPGAESFLATRECAYC